MIINLIVNLTLNKKTLMARLYWVRCRTGSGSPVSPLQGDHPPPLQPGLTLEAGSLAVTSGRKQRQLISGDTAMWTRFSCSAPWLLWAYTLSTCSETNSHTNTLQMTLYTHGGRAGVRISYSTMQQSFLCHCCGGHSWKPAGRLGEGGLAQHARSVLTTLPG